MKKLICLGLLSITLSSLVACESGPFEKWGKKVDDKAQEASDKINNRGPAEKLGNRIDKQVKRNNNT